MKSKKYIFTLITIVFFISQHQAQKTEKSSNKAFDIIHIDGKFNKNQLLLEFLSRNSRFGNGSQLKKLIEKQRNSNAGGDANANLRQNKKFGQANTSITKIYFDGDLILGEGIDRLYIIDQTRLKEIKNIKKTIASYDAEIYITSLNKS